jgi:two-component sensor histidine kinase
VERELEPVSPVGRQRSRVEHDAACTVGQEGRAALRATATAISSVGLDPRKRRDAQGRDRIDTLDLGAYLSDVCKDLGDSMSGFEVNVSAAEGIVVRTDRAIPAIFLVNELITNAAKYAYPGGNCRVWVRKSPISRL